MIGNNGIRSTTNSLWTKYKHLHYYTIGFDGSIEGLWRCTPKVIFFDCLFSGPEQMTRCESIHARQPQESLETTVGWASLRRVRKNKGIVPKVLPKNRFMSVVFNTRMSWWGSQHIDITVDVLLPTVCRPHDPREFRWKHHKYSTSVTRNLQIFPRKLGCANHGEKQILRIPLWESTNENRRPQSWPSLMNRITPR